MKRVVQIATIVLAIAMSAAPVAAARKATHSKPVKPAVNLYLSHLWFVGSTPVTLPGFRVDVSGVVRPYVPGQRVLVTAFQNGQRLINGYLRVYPSRNHQFGHFATSVRAQGIGEVVVFIRHTHNRRMRFFLVDRTYEALDQNVGFGSTGLFVQLMQQRLGALHIFDPQTGVYDSGMGLALDAYHRLLRWGTSQSLDTNTIWALLQGQGSFPVRFPTQGDHAEGNLTLQLLALVNGSQVNTIWPISSGKPSTPTILGSFQVYQRTPGYLPDGMYYSDFFTGGYAIHGFNPAPDYPASHGCMRLPIVDAVPVYNWLNYGDWVDTYY